MLESRAPGETPFDGGTVFRPVAPATDLGDWVRFGLTCAVGGCQQPAAGTAGADLSVISLGVVDETLPNFAVGGTSSPATGSLPLDIQATDTGSGLRCGVRAARFGVRVRTTSPAATIAVT